MPYLIASSCTGCGICAHACPVQCIQEKRVPYVIERERCVECGVCAEQCPLLAILTVPIADASLPPQPNR